MESATDNIYPRAYTQSAIESSFICLAGAGLCFGGLFITAQFLHNVHAFAAIFFRAILPAPMIFFGVYIIISALRYKITLYTDELMIEEGIFDTTIIHRNQIETYRINESKQLELKLDSAAKISNYSLAFDIDPVFLAWFDSVKHVPEYKEPEIINNEETSVIVDKEPRSLAGSIYPRVYKTKKIRQFIGGISILYLAYLIVGDISKHSDFYLKPSVNIEFYLRILILYVFALFTYVFFIKGLGYQVILRTDLIVVFTLFGVTKIYRDQIRSYSYRSGEYGNWIVISLKSTDKNGKNSFKEKKIELPFDLDQEFNDWFSAIPCSPRNSALPKIRVELE